MKRFLSILFASAAIGLAAAPAEATLTTIGTANYSLDAGLDYNLIYDEDLGLIWLDYSNALNTWQNQRDWAAGLNAGGVLTYNINPGLNVTWGADWRLPTVVPQNYNVGYDGTTGFGYNITTGSEMGHLFYTELGNKGYYATDGTGPQSGWGLVNTSPFTNLQPNFYWSGTEYAPNPNLAWGFYFNYGNQDADVKNDNLYALAVRPGDVAAVPEPGTMLLLGSGMAGLVAFRKRFGF